MPDHQDAPVQIGQLNLKIPGSNAETAHRVANAIGQDLDRMMRPGVQGRYGSLSLRVRTPLNAGDAEMSLAIAEAITRALQDPTPSGE
jgi:hypothetical protein